MRMERMKPTKIINGVRFYVVEDLVKILDLTPLTVRKYLQEGKIKSVKVGMRYYVAEKNLIAFLGGGRFFDQPDDLIMDKINQAIKLTFEANVPWLAQEVKKLIISDLTKIMAEKFKKIDENNQQLKNSLTKGTMEHLERRTEGVKQL